MTIKSDCIDKANELDIEIIGDVDFRGKCKAEDSELAQFFTDVRYNYPEYYDLIFHPEMEFKPQGGSSYAYHAKSKAKGRLDSIADIVCLPISPGAPAFICELKKVNFGDSVKSSKDKEHFFKQLARLESQKRHGAIAFVALGCNNAYKEFERYVNEYARASK